MATIKEQLFHEVAECDAHSNNKVTVVGIGQVGMACAFSILTQVRLKKNKKNQFSCVFHSRVATKRQNTVLNVSVTALLVWQKTKKKNK